MSNRPSKKRDGFHRRLLLYFKKATGIQFRTISNIKKSVWLASDAKKSWIIKEFQNPEKLKHQITFTKLLKKHGFKNTYQFHPVHELGPCHFDDRCFGMFQYIEPAQEPPFQFESARNREDASALLSHFHFASSKCVDAFKDTLPVFNLLEKWEKRLQYFKRNCQPLQNTNIYPYVSQYMQLGEQALQIMRSKESYFLKEPHCILHGDLAHHNFIRGNNGQLYIIDFDLISMGPKHIDMLQYCNRILPSLNWSASKLFAESETISQYSKEFSFLAALLYPADIFREWNYFATNDKRKRKKQWEHIKEITFLQFDQRLQFSKWMMDNIQ